MTGPDVSGLIGADFAKARKVADPRAIVDFTREGVAPEHLPDDASTFVGKPFSTRTMLIASVVGVVLAVVSVAYTAPRFDELRRSGDWPALILPALIVLFACVLPLLMHGHNRSLRPLNAAYPDLLGTAPTPGRVQRIWIETHDDGGIARVVTWISVDGGPDVVAGGVAERPVHQAPMNVAELPREGDRAWSWHARSGHTLIRIRRRRIGEA